MNKKVIKNSLFLIGPTGGGKSLHSRVLSKKTGLPVINLDSMRASDYPTDVEFLEKECARLDNAIRENRKRLESATGQERRALEIEREVLCRRHSRASEEYRIRQILPDVPVYADPELLTYIGGKGLKPHSPELSDGIRHIAAKHDVDPSIAWHNYQKMYEVALVNAVLENLKQPAIIDFGGGMPIALERDYLYVEQKAESLGVGSEALRDVVPFTPAQLKEMTSDVMARLPKENVVFFEPPKDMYTHPEKYQGSKGMERLMADSLNPAFLGTGQYAEAAGIRVDVTEALAGPEINFAAVESNCNRIVEQTNIQVQDSGHAQ